MAKVTLFEHMQSHRSIGSSTQILVSNCQQMTVVQRTDDDTASIKYEKGRCMQTPPFGEE